MIIAERPLWTLYAEGLLWARNVRQKPPWTLCALWEKKLPSVREKTPQWLAWVLSYREDTFYFSQKNTDEQNTQHSTETLSQPISQNLTATFSSNALWTLYAKGVLWARNSAQKGSVKSVSSVREKNTLRERKNTPACCFCVVSYSGSVLFLTEKHRWTEHTKVHRDIKSTDFTEPYSHL